MEQDVGHFEYFVDQLFKTPEKSVFWFGDVLMAMVVAALLCSILAHIYRVTHRGTSYSQTFLIALFMMGVTTSIIMLIIGSNVARAFSLVGALSVIRFRTAVKDTRDTAFLFAAISIGMGCGTQFYSAAILLTVFISILLLILHYMDYGIKEQLESVLNVSFKNDPDVQKNLEAVLTESSKSWKLINRILDIGDGQVTNVYVARPTRNLEVSEVERMLSQVDGVSRIAIYRTDQHAPF